MNIIWKYNILFASLALLTVSCSQEEDLALETPAPSDAYIRIVSGQVGYSTRAVDAEPQIGGQCNADMMNIYQFSKSVLGGQSITPSNMEYSSTYTTEVDHYSDQSTGPYYQGDKWARQSAQISLSGARNNGLAFTGLAFSKVDESKFSVNYQNTLNAMSFKLKGDDTPEVYFGRLEADGYSSDAITGIYSAYRSSITGTTETKALTGKLYRVVSQINVTISNVNPDLVDRMEMVLSNIPTEIGLYADHRTSISGNGSDHGFHYPIVVANSTQQSSGEVIVCKTSNFHNGEAKLSTFLLPSQEGRSLKIHVYFKEDIYGGEDEEGNPKTFREKIYDIRPPKSFYIPADIAEAYFSSEPLCVYNVTDNKFFSFSNVRVNITGDFDNFFPDRIDVDMDIEVCSRYDNDHTYKEEQIDYN